MPSERLSFKNRHGAALAARLEIPIDGVARAYALFAHSPVHRTLEREVRIETRLEDDA